MGTCRAEQVGCLLRPRPTWKKLEPLLSSGATTLRGMERGGLCYGPGVPCSAQVQCKAPMAPEEIAEVEVCIHLIWGILRKAKCIIWGVPSLPAPNVSCSLCLRAVLGKRFYSC